MDHLNDLAEGWFAWLVHSGWQAAAVACIVGLLLLLARRSSAQFRYALLLVALAKFAVPPFLSLPMGLFSSARPAIQDVLPIETFTVTDTGSGTDHPVSPSGDNLSVDSSPTSTAESLPRDAKMAPAVSPRPRPTAAALRIHWLAAAVALVHTLGVLLAGLSVGRRYRQVRKLVRNAQPAPAEVVQLAVATAKHLRVKRLTAVMVSGETDAPFATGVLNPVILLPKDVLGLPQDQLQIILGHELVHIRRYDLAVGWVETALGVLWWFHPAMWWLKRQLRATREDCCDDVLLASRLTEPDRYCETLIQAARSTFRPPEPLALGFAGGEHPAARRIRRLMNGSLFRTRRLRAAALLSAICLGAVVLPGTQPLRAPVKETTLEGVFGWRNLPFDPDREELAIIEECEQVVIDYRSTYGSEGRTLRRFDDLKTRDKLLALVERRPGFFYPKHLLGTWYRRNGDAAKGNDLLSQALREAPVVLTQRYRTGDGSPLAGVTIEGLEIECNRVRNHSLDPSLKLRFVDLVTDAEGEVTVPVYDTVYRLASRSFPEGYDTETARLGWFSAVSRIGNLPDVTAWKRYSRPGGFTRSAAESALLSQATGTVADELTLGPNLYRIARVARCQADGRFAERAAADSAGLADLPRPANAGYMDHAVIDLSSPDPGRYEIGRVTIMDSETKIPLTSFQAGTGVKVVDKSRFHVYSLGESLPAEIDFVLTVKNFDAGALRMKIPVEAEGTYTQDGVTFVNEYTVNEEFRAADTALRRFLSEVRSLIEVSLRTCGYQNDCEGHWRLQSSPGRPSKAALTLRERFADELSGISLLSAVSAEEAAVTSVAKLLCRGDDAQVAEQVMSLQEQATATHEQDMLPVEKLLMTAVVLGDAFASICDHREIARSRRGDHGTAALKLLQRFERYLERPAGRG